jgi:hypothetical protein
MTNEQPNRRRKKVAEESVAQELPLEEFLLAETQFFNQQTAILRRYQRSFEAVYRGLSAIAVRLETMPVPVPIPLPPSDGSTPPVLQSIDAYRQNVDATRRLPWDVEPGSVHTGPIETVQEALEDLVEAIEQAASEDQPGGFEDVSDSYRAA